MRQDGGQRIKFRGPVSVPSGKSMPILEIRTFIFTEPKVVPHSLFSEGTPSIRKSLVPSIPFSGSASRKPDQRQSLYKVWAPGKSADLLKASLPWKHYYLVCMTLGKSLTSQGLMSLL